MRKKNLAEAVAFGLLVLAALVAVIFGMVTMVGLMLKVSHAIISHASQFPGLF